MYLPLGVNKGNRAGFSEVLCCLRSPVLTVHCRGLWGRLCHSSLCSLLRKGQPWRLEASSSLHLSHKYLCLHKAPHASLAQSQVLPNKGRSIQHGKQCSVLFPHWHLFPACCSPSTVLKIMAIKWVKTSARTGREFQLIFAIELINKIRLVKITTTKTKTTAKPHKRNHLVLLT